MTTPDASAERLARVLESVPGPSEGPAPVADLCTAAGFGPDDARTAAEVFVGLLRASGAVLVTAEPETGRLFAKSKSPAAALFLGSLAAYLRAGVPVVDNWTRAGTVEPPYQPNQVLAGPQFLHLIEHRRLGLFAEAAPLRERRIVHVLVKTRFRLMGPRYLMIYDRAARQYQLPGGHLRADDPDPLAAAVRELEEELPEFAFDTGRDRLVELGEVDVTQQSRTYGAVTRYRIVHFQLVSTRQSLNIGPDGQWVSERTLLNEHALVKGRTLNTAGLRRLAAELPGGLGRLAAGLSFGRRPSLLVLLREKPWEVLGAALSVIGLVITLVQVAIEMGAG
ncbi:NUDIX hydrolase [Plantactinospora sonchi]|uniref:NUDIX hydrolase n=1 Tax=Plantactinospora sonchi TaxID=1544735 RepID=A0ABU7S562_9ACTN